MQIHTIIPNTNGTPKFISKLWLDSIHTNGTFERYKNTKNNGKEKLIEIKKSSQW